MPARKRTTGNSRARSPIPGYYRHLVGTYAPKPATFVRGKGARLWDSKGRDYIDFSSGIAVDVLGHADRQHVAAIARQAATLGHLSNLFAHDRLVPYARRLTRATRMEQAFFCNSGAEANECALKLARKRGVAIARSKYKVVSLNSGFHGRVGLALAASGAPRLWEAFGPQPPGFVHVAPDARAIAAAFSRNVCAMIVEPIIGEGGAVVLERKLLQLIARLCRQHDALLIADEVQCGMGRTGTLLRSFAVGIKPDIVTMSKGLAGGFPFGATLVAGRAAGVLGVGDHGTTFGGNPLAIAAADCVLRRIDRPAFLERVKAKSEFLRAALAGLKRQGAPIARVRGSGLMIGVVLDAARGAQAAAMSDRMFERGVLVAPASGNVLRIMPPLTVTKAEMTRGIARFGAALLAG